MVLCRCSVTTQYSGCLIVAGFARYPLKYMCFVLTFNPTTFPSTPTTGKKGYASVARLVDAPMISDIDHMS